MRAGVTMQQYVHLYCGVFSVTARQSIECTDF
jgi:hypothetical protein